MTGRSAGHAHLAVILIVLVLGGLVAGGYVVYQANRQQAASSAVRQARDSTGRSGTNDTPAEEPVIPRTDNELIASVQLAYCRSDYRRFWEATYQQTLDPNRITARYDDTVKEPLVVDGTHAVVNAAICDTPELDDSQKFAAFMLYFTKTGTEWKAYERYQETPPCAKFDGDKWPVSIIAECTDNGTVRAPKQ